MNRYRLNNICLIFFLSINGIVGQNIVKNFDFSKKSACPTTMSQITLLSDWQTAQGTADYFDLCGVGYGGAPNHPWGYQWPYSDSGFVNFGYGESFKQTLSDTIKQGQSVYYEYYATRGENGQYAICNFGIQFKFSGKLVQKEIYQDTLIESTNWVPISGCFIAPSDINEIEIGYISGVTGKVLIDASKTFSQGYAYIDDVKVIPGFTLDLGNDTTLCSNDGLTLDAQIVGGNYVWSTLETSQTISVSSLSSTSSNNMYYVDVSLGVCNWKDTMMIQFQALPTVNLGSDQTFCSSQSVLLDAGNTGYTYQWSNGKTTQTITENTSGTYWVAVNDGFCTGYDTVELTALSAPTVNLGNDTSVCSNETIVLDAGNSGLTYNWSTGATSQSISISNNGSTSASGNYWVKVSNGLCAAYDTALVTFKSIPVVNLGSDQAICQGQSITLDAGNSGASYLWSTSATSQTITVSTAGKYYVEVSQNGCSGSDSISVEVNPSPVVDLGNDTGLCKGGSIVLDAGNSGATYLWSNGSSNQTLTIKDTMFVSGGYFSVVVSQGSCIDEDTIKVVFYDQPNVSMADTLFCQNTSVVLDATYSGANAYNWSTGDTTASINVGNQSQYSVIINNNGCLGYDTVNTFIIPVVEIDLGEDSILCENDSLMLNLGNAGTNYAWSNGETSNSIVVTYAGQYSVIVENAGCFTYDTITISYQTYPVVGLSSDKALCMGESITLGTAYSDALYTWSTGDTSQYITVDESGEYWLIVEINHCRDTDSVAIVVNPLPVFELGKDQSICPDEELIIFPQVQADVLIWLPSLLNGSSLSVNEPGTYSLTAVDSNGCSYTDSIMVNDYCPSVVYVPSSFTPNNDGKNDVFIPKGNNVFAFSMYIFDRWGNQIFYSNDLTIGWDGNLNGKPAVEEVYSWKVYYEGERENNIGLQKQMLGYVALIR